MSDITDRLRKDADGWGCATHTWAGPNVAALEREAANEITRLRAEVESLRLFKRSVLDPENQPSQYGTTLVPR